MGYKKIILLLLSLSVLSLGIGILAEPGSFGLGCVESGVFCSNPFVSIPGEPFLSISLSLLLTSILLFFVKRETFITWAKIASPAFAIMLALMFYTYNNTPQMGGWVNWGSDEEFATVLLPPLFFLISLAVITYKQLKLREKR